MVKFFWAALSAALSIVISGLLNSTYAQTILKYSGQDCVFCNAQLYNIPDKAAERVQVWLKTSIQTDPEFASIIKILEDKKFRLLFSDSAYYSIDSSERSTVYLLQDGVVRSSAYLKDIEPQMMEKYFIINSSTGKIYAKKVLKIVPYKDQLYLLDGYHRILVVNKSHLNMVSNVLEINDSAVKHTFISALVKVRRTTNFIKYQSILSSTHLPDKIRINDFGILNDTFFLAMSTLFADSSIEKGYYAYNKPFISAYINGKLVKVFIVDGMLKGTSSNPKFTIDASNMVYRNGCFLLSINTDSLANSAPMLAVMQAQGEQLNLLHLAKYSLPNVLVSSNIGYMMSGVLSGGNYISNTYSSDIYDIDKNAPICLGFDHKSNLFTSEQVRALHFRINFQVLGLYGDDNRLVLVVKNGDSVECISYALHNSTPSFTSRHTLDINNKYAYSNWIACDTYGVYTFNEDEHTIEFVPYP